MISSLSKPRSSKEHLIIHMKFAILVFLTFVFWSAPGARRAASVMLRDVANFVQPEPTTMQEKINQFNTCLQ